MPTDFVIVRVIFPVLEMVAVDYSGLSFIALYFPVVEVYFLKELLLMMLKLTHC